MASLPDTPSALDRLTPILQRAQKLDQVMIEALDVFLDVFECDRAWLLFPCDPGAAAWRVPMERTRNAWPGAMELGVDHPMVDEVRHVFSEALSVEGALCHGPGFELDVPQDIIDQFKVQSQMTMAIQPALGQAWMLGLHSCAEPKNWSAEAAQLFTQMGERMGQVLNTLLTQEEHRQREERLRNILDMTEECIIVIDQRGRILDSNANASLLFELPRAGLHAQNLFAMSPAQQPAGMASLQAARDLLERACGEDFTVAEWSFRSSKGTEHQCEVCLARIQNANPTLLRVSITEIARHREMEERRLHSERMEGLGRLVGGIAHDFNNILTAIQGANELAQLKLEASHPALEELEIMAKATKRAEELTHQLLAYGRKQIIEPQVLNLNQVVETTLGILERIIDKSVELKLNLDRDRLDVLADPGQVVQVMMNLVTNANDALGPGGCIEIQTATAQLDPEYCKNDPDLLPGQYGVLTVTDNGVGMDQETRTKVFEPFFTTKPHGKGTGLGLSMAYGIARQHRGQITVESELDKGSSLHLYLPLATQGARDLIPALKPKPVAHSSAGTQASAARRILVIDDEPMIRNMLVQAFEMHGYGVTAPTSEAKALQYANAVDVVLCDINLWRTDGVELVRGLRRLNPKLKVLFMSGFGQDKLDADSVLDQHTQFIPKPFAIAAILERLDSMLAQSV